MLLKTYKCIYYVKSNNMLPLTLFMRQKAKTKVTFCLPESLLNSLFLFVVVWGDVGLFQGKIEYVKDEVNGQTV